jgi:hypothetical protein
MIRSLPMRRPKPIAASIWTEADRRGDGADQPISLTEQVQHGVGPVVVIRVGTRRARCAWLWSRPRRGRRPST